ncbi:MAG: HpcH/HpaI aldolase/citrate lyase family protein [Clostridiales Family XIII bacterium]|jgi:citrate lyase beta subunit|nr:HpcH/HpaI aldolase/citrate lyase family protein [Clostridiales Family XIII bacterium]
MIETPLPYRVGALMYSPTLNTSVVKKLTDGSDLTGDLKYLDSLVLCLEDAITDSGTEQAELALCESLAYITNSRASLPLLFVRPRSPEQLTRLLEKLGTLTDCLTGFVFPKFDTRNGGQYIEVLTSANAKRAEPFYMMPIIETPSVIHVESRLTELREIKEMIGGVKDMVLNVRVGGNDFCGLYGLRRKICQTIYDIEVVRDTLTSVINIFARDFVVSAPVWEYFESANKYGWSYGLARECELDLLNGFIGKTAIHPTQLKIIRNSIMPDRCDYEDALNILNWGDDLLGVRKSCNGTRMNEVSVHTKWAQKVVALAEIYGVKE